MPKPKKNSTAANSNGATVGYEAQLWQMADALRGSMDAAEYKHVALGLIFLKYISDAFEEQHAKLVAEIEKACKDIKPNMHFWPELFGLVTYTHPLATVRADTGFVCGIEKALADGRRGDVLKLDEPLLSENLRLSDHSLWSGFAT